MSSSENEILSIDSRLSIPLDTSVPSARRFPVVEAGLDIVVVVVESNGQNLDGRKKSESERVSEFESELTPCFFSCMKLATKVSHSDYCGQRCPDWVDASSDDLLRTLL
jgi:hypothetical protein